MEGLSSLQEGCRWNLADLLGWRQGREAGVPHRPAEDWKVQGMPLAALIVESGARGGGLCTSGMWWLRWGLICRGLIGGGGTLVSVIGNDQFFNYSSRIQ